MRPQRKPEVPNKGPATRKFQRGKFKINYSNIGRKLNPEGALVRTAVPYKPIGGFNETTYQLKNSLKSEIVERLNLRQSRLGQKPDYVEFMYSAFEMDTLIVRVGKPEINGRIKNKDREGSIYLAVTDQNLIKRVQRLYEL